MKNETFTGTVSKEYPDTTGNEFTIEGRNAVIEAYRAGKPVDKLLIQDGLQDGPIRRSREKQKNTIQSQNL